MLQESEARKTRTQAAVTCTYNNVLVLISNFQLTSCHRRSTMQSFKFEFSPCVRPFVNALALALRYAVRTSDYVMYRNV